MNLEDIIAAVEASEEEQDQKKNIRNLSNAILALNEGLMNQAAELERIRKHLRDAGTRGTL